MTPRRILTGNRRFRAGRVVGVRTLVQTVVWSLVAVAVLTVYRTPALLDGRLTAGAVLDALPVVLVPVVVLGVVVVVVLLNLVGELRYVLFGRRRPGTYESSQYDEPDDDGLFGMFAGFGDIGGDDGGDDE